MKIFKTLLAVLILVISFSSCQKDTDFGAISKTDSTITSQTSKVKTYTEDVTSPSVGHSVITYNLTYDGNDRISTMISTTNPGDKFVYQYGSNNTYTMDLYNSNVLSIHTLFFINSSSLVDSSFQYNNTKDTSSEKYIYNSAKQMIKLKDYEYLGSSGPVLSNTHDYTLDSNGNVLTETDMNSTITYDYYTNLANNLSSGERYFYENKNLTKTTTYKASGVIETLNHTYTFDSSNRITSEKMVSSTGEIVIRTYTY